MEYSEGERRCSAYKQLKSARSNQETYWQTLHDYYYIEAENINRTYYPGTELDFDYLYDTTSLSVANILPSGIANYMTPFSGKWAGIRHRDPVRNNAKPVRMWMKAVEEEVFYTLSKSNFYDQIIPFYKGSSIYGTSVMLTEDDLQDVIRFYDLPVKNVCIVEDARQRVAEYYIEFEYTAEQAVDRFGIDNVSREVRESFIEGKRSEEKYKYILYIGPRHDRNVTKEDNLNMPIQALWIEIESKKIVQESGYEIMPAFTHRFYKRSALAYGFSPAMNALADARWLQAISKTELESAMKISDPALALPDNAFVLPLNLNNSALNYYNADVMNKDSIFPVGNYGNVQVNEMMYQKKVDVIKEHMFYDVFLAFQGIDKQMTVPEVMQRANERMTLLGPAIGRFQSDVLDDVFHITINKLFKAGRLPPIPDELMEDPTYEIEYTSVLALAQKSSDLNSMDMALARVGQMAQYNPAVLDKIDFDRAVDEIWENSGADPSVLNDAKEVAEVREVRDKAQADEQQKFDIQQGAEVAETASKTAKNMSEAQA